MSQANTGQYEEMVQNHVSWIFCKYLYQAKTRTHIGILGQHFMYLGLFQPFKTTNSAENQEKTPKIACGNQP